MTVDELVDLSLLDYLSYKAQCGCISNLHCVGAHRIHWAVEKRPAEAFSLESWLDAIEYITKAPPPVPLERCEDAKQILLKGLM